jgi:pyruvate dehydrogenase E2 component (dihydrolipoamide acetyltransferase)
MLKTINMPDGGQNTDQLLVVSWKKQVGDSVRRGDILLEIETDKAVLEVESFAEGILLVQAVAEGSYGTVGEPIAFIGRLADMKDLPGSSSRKEVPTAGGQPAEAENVALDPGTAAQAGTGVKDESYAGVGSFKASPAAKKLARDHGLDLADVAHRSGKAIVHAADVQSLIAAAHNGPQFHELIPLTAMRRTIAERMAQAASVPAFNAEVEVDMTECVRLRDRLNAPGPGVRVAYHDIVAKCMALAARDHPLVNASYTEHGIRVFRQVNLGLAVSVDGGLIVPVLPDIGSKGLAQLASESEEHIARVRSGKFDPRLTEGGTITLSNLGMFPISRFTALLNPPQSCIIALGSILRRAVWVDGKCCERPLATLTATFDHRVVDGAYGAAFLATLKQILETPQSILLQEHAQR